MNKLVTGSIAGAAGIALLLGGAGTLALWNDSATASGGNVQSGALTVALAGTPVWKDISPDSADTSWSPVAVGSTPADRLVPGDTVTLTQRVDVTATGKNLQAELSFDPKTIAIKAPYNTIVAPATAPAVTVAMTATKVASSGNATIVASAAPNSFLISAGAGGRTTFEIVFTVAFDSRVTAKDAQNQADAVVMDKPGITVTQVRPVTAP